MKFYFLFFLNIVKKKFLYEKNVCIRDYVEKNYCMKKIVRKILLTKMFV